MTKREQVAEILRINEDCFWNRAELIEAILALGLDQSNDKPEPLPDFVGEKQAVTQSADECPLSDENGKCQAWSCACRGNASCNLKRAAQEAIQSYHEAKCRECQAISSDHWFDHRGCKEGKDA